MAYEKRKEIIDICNNKIEYVRETRKPLYLK